MSDQARPDRRRLGRLGRQSGRDPAIARRGRRLSDDGLSRRSDDVAARAGADEGSGSRLSARFRRLSRTRSCRDRAASGVRVVTNAGGVNPAGMQARAGGDHRATRACRSRWRCVEGDDVMPLIEGLRAQRPARGGLRAAAAGAAADRQRLSRRPADQGRARCAAPTSSSPGAAPTARSRSAS